VVGFAVVLPSTTDALQAGRGLRMGRGRADHSCLSGRWQSAMLCYAAADVAAKTRLSASLTQIEQQWLGLEQGCRAGMVSSRRGWHQSTACASGALPRHSSTARAAEAARSCAVGV
jgi:hypothetical protein